jgi:hypothetical protein
MSPTIRRVLRAAAGAVLYLAILAFPAGAERQVSGLDTQVVFDRQALLLDRAFDRLLPSDAERPHLYFVGFAGYGREAVFKREVIAVRQLFDDRFGTTGRSIALINHRSTLEEFPLASVGNLASVLERLGQVMNRDKDVLFLFLTSHGDKGLLAVDMPGFGLISLTPERLASILERSGITNRLIVVSACHSGSFIPALAGPRTLVIAAAHADRTSFGCNDQREWTYFGDAFFNRSLRAETSLPKAFARAQELISEWEQRDRLLPSLPQIAGGEELSLQDWPLSND